MEAGAGTGTYYSKGIICLKMRKTNINGLPRGAGSMQMLYGSYWLRYRDADGAVIQENAHTQDDRVARILLAERALERTARFEAQMLGVISESTASLTRAGYVRAADGRFIRAATAGNARGSRGVDRSNQPASGNRKGAAA